MLRQTSLLAGVVAGTLLLLPTVALGNDRGGAVDPRRPEPQRVSYDLKPVPHDPAKDGGSNAEGDVTITRVGDRVTVHVRAEGLSPNLVHAQHIHGVGQDRCPGPEARSRRVADGLIDTTEGLPDYGPIQVSLTTSGDTSPASGLAVDRFPVADAHGRLDYLRVFTVGKDIPAEVADHLAIHHVVIHGIDLNHNGQYDFLSAGPSDLNPALPQEATIPATCGVAEAHHMH